MPNRTVYIRVGDLDDWDKLDNKSDWVHESLKTLGRVDAPKALAATPATPPAPAWDPQVCRHGRKGKCITCGFAPFKDPDTIA